MYVLQPYIRAVTLSETQLTVFHERPDNELFEALEKLWQDDRIRAMFRRRSEYQVEDSIE